MNKIKNTHETYPTHFQGTPIEWEEYTYRSKEEKQRNKRKERRIEHALRTRNITELLEVEDEWED